MEPSASPVVLTATQVLNDRMVDWGPEFLVEDWSAIEFKQTLWVTVRWKGRPKATTFHLDVSDEGWPGALRAKLGRTWDRPSV